MKVAAGSACVTQLLNAGCRITSIQKFLGHKKLNTIMIYARAYDQTFADDYFAAMSRVEQRMELVGVPEKPPETVPQGERQQLLALAEQLAQPEVSQQTRLDLVAQICLLLAGGMINIGASP